MGMYALGMIDRLEDVEKMTTISKTFLPDPATHQRYMQSYAVFDTLYPKLKDSFSQIYGY